MATSPVSDSLSLTKLAHERTGSWVRSRLRERISSARPSSRGPINPLVQKHYQSDEPMAGYFFSKFNVRERIVRRLSGFSPERLTAILERNMREHLVWLEVFGVLLGCVFAALFEGAHAFLALLPGIIELGRFAFTQSMLYYAAEEGTRWAIVNPPPPDPATTAELQAYEDELKAFIKSKVALGGLIDLVADGTLSGRLAKEVFDEMWKTGKQAPEIVEKKGLKQISDSGEIEGIVAKIVAENPGQVEQFRSGNEKVIGWFVGQVMKATQGKANPKLVNEVLRKALAG